MFRNVSQHEREFSNVYQSEKMKRVKHNRNGKCETRAETQNFSIQRKRKKNEKKSNIQNEIELVENDNFGANIHLEERNQHSLDEKPTTNVQKKNSSPTVNIAIAPLQDFPVTYESLRAKKTRDVSVLSSIRAAVLSSGLQKNITLEHIQVMEYVYGLTQ